MPMYSAFNCLIDSEIALPVPVRAADLGSPDVIIRRGAAEPLGREAIGFGGYIQTLGERVSVNIGQVGRFNLNAGREIIVDARFGVSDDAVRVYLLGLIMGVILMQRGMLTFHAGAVARGGRAIAFMGDKGSGKSTMTAYCCRHGFQLLSEDLLALTDDGPALTAWPGYPRLKLTDESGERLGVVPDEREPVFGKQILWLNDRFHEAPARLERIYLLQTGQPARLHPCDPTVAARELVTHWFGTQFGAELVHGFGPGRLLAHAVAVARRVPVCLLTRPLEWAALPDVLQHIEADLAADGTAAAAPPYLESGPV